MRLRGRCWDRGTRQSTHACGARSGLGVWRRPTGRTFARRGRPCGCRGGPRGRGSLGRAVLDSGDGYPRGDAADRQGDVVLLSKNPSPRHGGRGRNDPNTAQAWLWNPATGNTKRVDPPLWRDPGDGQLKPANIWCARPDLHGRRAAGRLRRQPALLEGPVDFKGLNKVYTFNPWNETWTEQPDMRHGRWYPTGVRMADGRIVIIDGLDESGAGFNTQPRRRAVHALAGPQRARHRQPARHPRRRRPAADRRALPAHVRDALRTHAGRRDRSPKTPGFSTRPVAANSFTWQDYPDSSRDRLWGTAVLVPGGTGRLDAGDAAGRLGAAHDHLDHHRHRGADDRDLRRGEPLGGLAGRPPRCTSGAATTTPCCCPTARWSRSAAASASETATSGQADAAQRQVELWDPATGAWRLGAAQAESRAYHSTALLLPDGRVVSAGDDVNGGIDQRHRRDLRAPLPLQGPAPDDHGGSSQRALRDQLRRRTPQHQRHRRRTGRARRDHPRQRHEPALHPARPSPSAPAASRSPRPPTPTSRPPATTCSSCSTTEASRRSPGSSAWASSTTLRPRIPRVHASRRPRP